MDIKKYITFIEEAEKLKSVVRTAWSSTGRRESTAEHSWRLALLAGVLLDKNDEIDITKVLFMCLIHDIGEIYEGDISAALRPNKEDKYQAEYEAAKKVFSLLPEGQADRMMKIWLEYNENMTPEAKLVKALDKAETIIQHNQGENPLDFDYKFNLEYGKEYFEQGDLLKTLRTLLDEKTEEKIVERNKGVT